jgi:hypothetical protein
MCELRFRSLSDALAGEEAARGLPEQLEGELEPLNCPIDGKWLVPGDRLAKAVEGAAEISNSCSSARSVMDDDAFLQDLLAEMLGRLLHADEIDAQERRRLFLEIQRELEPFLAIHGGRLDREVDAERSKWLPRAREPDSQTRSTAGCRASWRASSRISSRRGQSVGRTSLVLRCGAGTAATIARISMRCWRQARRWRLMLGSDDTRPPTPNHILFAHSKA